MPDIRSLVHRIQQVLGPDASTDRVEASAALVLEATVADVGAGASPAGAAGERAIVTAYGLDRPGILHAITEVVAQSGCNILDVSQKILQGYFTLIMLADIGQMHPSIQELQERLGQTGERLGVRVTVQHEDLFNAMHRP